MLDKEAVIQDYNSQQTINSLQSQFKNPKARLAVWDCCAGSGGKSISIKDKFPNAVLTVSDVRESILINLKKRFLKAGIKKYTAFVADLTKPKFEFRNSSFDLILCDAPCTGSGTWSRTPEELYFFKVDKINYYSDLQKNITRNAAKSLKAGGLFLYITCSVFKKENEEVVEFIQSNTALRLLAMQYFIGYNTKADNLFAALLTATGP